jgi:molybdate transport system ATP-binding protein
MTLDFAEIDPNRFAAILYRPEDDVDTLLTRFALERRRAGDRLGGIVQVNEKNIAGQQVGMNALDLMTDRSISLCQPLGSGAMACKLDAGGLAEAAMVIADAISADVDLIVINKFSKQEAAGRGLRSEFADAILSGTPLLTAVPEKCFDDWLSFTGDRGTTLHCAPHVVAAWWQELSARQAMRRARAAATPPNALLADHHV